MNGNITLVPASVLSVLLVVAWCIVCVRGRRRRAESAGHGEERKGWDKGSFCESSEKLRMRWGVILAGNGSANFNHLFTNPLRVRALSVLYKKNKMKGVLYKEEIRRKIGPRDWINLWETYANSLLNISWHNCSPENYNLFDRKTLDRLFV